MAQEYNARIKLKRDTSTNWTTNNPILLNGEVVLVDTAAGELRAKIGDGTKTYTQLPFADELLETLLDIPALISEHNSASDAHSDIRTLISGLNTELNTKADIAEVENQVKALADGAVADNTADIASINAQLTWGSF